MKRRRRRLMPADGHLFIVAMDHTSFLDAPVPALARYGDTCATAVANGADAFLVPLGPAPARARSGDPCAPAVANGADAFLVPLGSATLYAEQIGPAALIASVPTSPPLLEHVIERALAVGADARKVLLYPLGEENSEDEAGALRVFVAGVIVSGSTGVAFGTNIWTHPAPGKMTAAIAAVLHGGASVDEALARVELPAAGERWGPRPRAAPAAPA